MVLNHLVEGYNYLYCFTLCPSNQQIVLQPFASSLVDDSICIPVYTVLSVLCEYPHVCIL